MSKARAQADVERELRVACDNYGLTVLALQCLCNEMAFDDRLRKLVDDVSAHAGRKMRTSPGNAISKDTDVTPDVCFRRKDEYFAVLEAKAGLPNAKDILAIRLDEIEEQCRKYDDDLTGWDTKTETTPSGTSHDICLITNIESVKRIEKRLREAVGVKEFKRNLTLMAVMRQERQDGSWPTIEQRYGKVGDADKQSKFEDSAIPIRPEVIARNKVFGLAKFTDDEPPLPLMMDLIHSAIMRNLRPDEKESYRLDGRLDKIITVWRLREWLSAFAFPRSDRRDPYIPKNEWIAPAVTALVRLGWASRHSGDRTHFTYLLRRNRKGISKPFDRFVDACAKRRWKQIERESRSKERREAKRLKQEQKDLESAPLFKAVIDNPASKSKDEGG